MIKAKTSPKSLQKLTESQTIFNKLVESEKIEKTYLNGASNELIIEVINLIVGMLYELKGVKRDEFITKFDMFLIGDVKNQLWENNHLLITQAISKHSSIYNAMPSKSQISEATGISRQTVHNHMKDFSSNPLFIEQVEQFKFMGQRVLAQVMESALGGDTKAARLYFDMIGQSVKPATAATQIKNQNNYIQINGTVLSQDTIKQLSPEQLNQIEGILKLGVPTAAPEKEAVQ